jgi:hypothetical protein
VNPTPITVSGTEEVFSVNVTVTGVMDLYACEFKLYYDPTLLKGVSIIEGPFLRSQGITFFLKSFDETNGFARVADAVLGDVPGVTGSGVIATITFQTKQLGSSNLMLQDTKLANSNEIPIVHTTSGGVVQIFPVVRDVAVTNVVVSAVEAEPGQVVNVSAIVVNQGGRAVSFNVTAYADDTLVGTKAVLNLASGSSASVVIPWYTNGFAYGDYTIRAEAEAHPEETDLADNVFIDGIVKLVPGTHDVTVKNVSISQYELHEGQIGEIQVVVGNNGNFTETFSVSTFFGETFIQTQTVNSLAPASERILVFLWNTSGFLLNTSYSIKAVSDTVPGEVNLEDNIMVDGTAIIYPRIISSLIIVSLIPSNQIGTPASIFRIGNMAYFQVTINATAMGPEPVLVTLNMLDSGSTAIGVVSFQGPIVPGVSSFILGLPVPQSANLGTASVYADIFTNWPHLGGIPYCPERSATFQIGA